MNGSTVTIWTKSYWIGTAERVLATFLAVFLAVITKGAVQFGWEDGFDLSRINWWLAVQLAAGSAFLSLLKCVLGNLKDGQGPSLTTAEKTVPRLPAPADS